MMKELLRDIRMGKLDARFQQVYGCEAMDAPAHRARYAALLERYLATFGPDEALALYSAPGRTELGGNHTDHQRGRVLAAAVDLDTIACAAPCDGEIHILSAGYPELRVRLDELTPRPEELGTSAALVRGIAARIAELGYPLRGFRAVLDSDVPGGSCLSSSAVYEVLIGVILNHLCCDDALTPVQIAQIGQYAENEFFGKPCGLMDQLASAVGGVAAIDFKYPDRPVVQKLSVRPEEHGYCLCIIDSGADHADLTDEYAAVPAEMSSVANAYGLDALRDLSEDDFWAHLSELREHLGDRAVLRAIHFFRENQRVQEQAEALAVGAFDRFLWLVDQSGVSSATLLQNLGCAGRPREQALAVTIAAAQSLLGQNCAVRVHGGGFAGTVQAYVPLWKKDEFQSALEEILKPGCCHFIQIRPEGGCMVAE